MIRNTVACILAVLALGQSVLSSTTILDGTTTVLPNAVSSSGLSNVASSSAFSNIMSSSSAEVKPNAVSSSGLSNVASSSAFSNIMSSSSAEVMSSSASSVLPSPSLGSSSGISSTVQSSFVSSSASLITATPVLSSSILSSSVIVVHTSSMSVIVSTSAVSYPPAKPTAVPYPQVINITDQNNKTCLLADLEADFKIFYDTTEKVQNQTVVANTSIALNGGAGTIDRNGSCSSVNGTGNANFEIKWNEHGDGPQHVFKMSFILNEYTWNVSEVMVVFYTEDKMNFKNASKQNITAVYTGNHFGSRRSGSNYICDSNVPLKMGNVTATFMKVNLQPFTNKDKVQTTGGHCAADGSDDDDDDDDNTVPIAVGAALGGLVLIVLVAYIIGRRRSNRGYEQV